MKRFLLVVFLFGIFGLTGCAALSGKNRDTAPEILEPQAVLKFGDVPIPAGFKAVPQDSYSFESSGIRVGLLKYRGKADVDQVINFYKEQMPMYNWRLLNVVEYGQRMLNFDREQESCIVSLFAKGKAVEIIISLGPKSQSPKRAERPIK
ncbi:MAG: hypothetical protein WC321_07365 [Candidatus Omnitrophota bacterium]|jgi:hypothetical protein